MAVLEKILSFAVIWAASRQNMSFINAQKSTLTRSF